MAFPYMEAVVGFMILTYTFETYLDLRQHIALKLPTLPKTLEGVISQEKFEKSRAYSIDKSNFHFIHDEFVTILMDSAILFFGMLPWFWKRSGVFLVVIGLDAENEILDTLSLILSWCYAFVTERRSLPTWGVYACFVASDDDYLPYSILIAPLFNKFTPHTVIPLQRIVSFVINLVSRAFEFQADAFAKKLGYSKPLRAALACETTGRELVGYEYRPVVLNLSLLSSSPC